MIKSEESKAAVEKMTEYLSDHPFEEKQMYHYMEVYAAEHHLTQTQAALPFARKCHEGQFRAGKKKTPYICHPLFVTCHAVALHLSEDEILAAALLHDVCEDCGVTPEELPVGEKAREAVRCLTRDPSPGGMTPEGKRKYYDGIAKNDIATIIKLLDRCNNISTMIEGFPRKKVADYIRDTENYIFPLFYSALQFYPEHTGEIVLIQYHMNSVITAVKHELRQKEKR